MGVALVILNSLLILPIPLLVAVAIDDALSNDDVRTLAWASGAILGVTLLSAVVQYFGARMTLGVTKQMAIDLRQQLLEKLYGASRGYVQNHDPGEFHDRLTAHTDRADQAGAILLMHMLPNAFMAVGMLGLLVYINLLLTVVTLATGAVYVLVNRKLVAKILPHVDRHQEQVTVVSAGIWASLRGQELARLQAAEEVDLRARRAELERWKATAVKRSLADIVYHVCQQSMLATIAAVILLTGGILVANGSLSIGDLLAFYAGFALLRGPLGSTSTDIPLLIEGISSMDRIHELRHAIDERPYQGTERIRLEGRFELRDVHVDYGRGPVLQGISLELQPGRITALAGPNGCGKSTVVSLILGAMRPDSGTVLADGRPYDELDVRDLVSQMGIVSQEPPFFVGSIRENLRYGSGDVSEDELWHALEVATADEFVRRLPAGLDTEIGDDGVLLSGGQRQRLAIARALVRRPRVLVMDEPTNHLDQQSIDRVLRNLRRLDNEPTVLIVTHQNAVFGAVDETIRLSAGRVVEAA